MHINSCILQFRAYLRLFVPSFAWLGCPPWHLRQDGFDCPETVIDQGQMAKNRFGNPQ
ncbi:MAG: hypothetical protein MUF72_22730 [Elainella sp. Prado103]|nr:hypothetical protein [Elainella sp. Prado103]